jgi:hypothetical protein
VNKKKKKGRCRKKRSNGHYIASMWGDTVNVVSYYDEHGKRLQLDTSTGPYFYEL